MNQSCLSEWGDVFVMTALVQDLGLVGARDYAERIAAVPGGHYSAQYQRIAEELTIRIKQKFDERLRLLEEISALPGYHPVDGDLGSVPL